MYTHNEHETPTGGDVGVRLGGEDAENVVVLVDRLAKVATLLGVPPIHECRQLFRSFCLHRRDGNRTSRRRGRDVDV